MAKTKIDWADQTWNPVYGCSNKCPYCYARGIARRFAIPVGKKETLSRLTRAYYQDEDVGHENEVVEEAIIGRLYNFQPTWLESNFNKPFPKRPSVIFVNSMSDIAYWETDWMMRVIERIRENPQYTFIMLTKEPEFFDCTKGLMLYDPVSKYLKPDNLKIGLTVDGSSEGWVENELGFFNFINFEPLQCELEAKTVLEALTEFNVEWVIIGAETGNRKGKIVPEREWIEEIVEAARDASVPVWMKDNLKDVWGGELIREHTYREVKNV